VAEVRDHEQAAGAGGQALPDVDGELEERVELQELDAGPLEDLGAGHRAEDALHRPVGPVVAVAHRVLDEASPGVEQAVVDAPGVDPGRRQRLAPTFRGPPGVGETLLEAVEDAAERPAEAPGVEDRRVVEAVDLLQDEPVLLHAAEHRPPAARPQVERQVHRQTMPAPPPARAGRSAAFVRR